LGARKRVAYRVGDVGQVGAEAEVDGGEDGEDGDNQFRRQHALPGLHALLAESRVGGLVLGGIRLGLLRFLFGGIGAATTSGCHGGRDWVVVGARVRCLEVDRWVAEVEKRRPAKTKMGSHSVGATVSSTRTARRFCMSGLVRAVAVRGCNSTSSREHTRASGWEGD